MRISLVGYTGFVGSNLYNSGHFDSVYNSKNIGEAYGTRPDILIYAGLRAEKYLANQLPQKDFSLIEEAEENIKRIQPNKLVLISSIDVFKRPIGVNENTVIDTEGLQPYGLHRYILECWVRENYPQSLIVRLPALYGKNLKKNFLFDLINIVPSMLKEDKYLELAEIVPDIQCSYQKQDNGFYKLVVHGEKLTELRVVFGKIGFSALNFTDSRSCYQFYNLKNLYEHIMTAVKEEIPLLHTATEPVSAAEVYYYLKGQKFVNYLNCEPAYYDYRTIYDGLFGGTGDGYLYNKHSVLEDIKCFVEAY